MSNATNKTNKQTTANRGMKFEEQIQNQCNMYKKQGIAYIDKLPTAWKVIRKGKFIVSAFPEAKSKLDFYGTLNNGESIYIEAKSCQANSIPLNNFKEHQFVYLEELKHYTNHVYVIVEMKKHNKIFLIEGDKILKFKEEASRKSIPIDWMESNGRLLEGVDFISEIKLGSNHKCWHCGSQLVWGSDFSFDDFGYENDGVVSILSCSNENCGCEVEYRLPLNEKHNKI